jgi:hypothetical protein
MAISSGVSASDKAATASSRRCGFDGPMIGAVTTVFRATQARAPCAHGTPRCDVSYALHDLAIGLGVPSIKRFAEHVTFLSGQASCNSCWNSLGRNGTAPITTCSTAIATAAISGCIQTAASWSTAPPAQGRLVAGQHVDAMLQAPVPPAVSETLVWTLCGQCRG